MCYTLSSRDVCNHLFCYSVVTHGNHSAMRSFRAYSPEMNRERLSPNIHPLYSQRQALPDGGAVSTRSRQPFMKVLFAYAMMSLRGKEIEQQSCATIMKP